MRWRRKRLSKRKYSAKVWGEGRRERRSDEDFTSKKMLLAICVELVEKNREMERLCEAVANSMMLQTISWILFQKSYNPFFKILKKSTFHETVGPKYAQVGRKISLFQPAFSEEQTCCLRLLISGRKSMRLFWTSLDSRMMYTGFLARNSKGIQTKSPDHSCPCYDQWLLSFQPLLTNLSKMFSIKDKLCNCVWRSSSLSSSSNQMPSPDSLPMTINVCVI